MALKTFISNLHKISVFRKPLHIANFDKRSLFEKTKLFSDKNGKLQTSFPMEGKIQDILRKSFPSAEFIEVRDVSGGCGAMFEVCVIANDFKGLTIVKQHRLVNEALKEEIKDMHGLRIHTALPSNPS